jgi:hypothetical protein
MLHTIIGEFRIGISLGSLRENLRCVIGESLWLPLLRSVFLRRSPAAQAQRSRQPASLQRLMALPRSSKSTFAGADTRIAGTRRAGMALAGIGAGITTVVAAAGVALKDGTAGGIEAAYRRGSIFDPRQATGLSARACHFPPRVHQPLPVRNTSAAMRAPNRTPNVRRITMDTGHFR